MSSYRCGGCGEVTKELLDASGTLRCSKCGYKIFFKTRQPVARKVKAR